MLLLALAIAPGAFWLWYFRAKDRLRPEPRHVVLRVFILGGVAAFVAGLLELGVLQAVGLREVERSALRAVAAALIVALAEEILKFLAVFRGAYRHREFDEVFDGIVYAVAASLGFATVENVFYVLEGGVTVGLVRAVLSVPGHAFFGVLMGYYMGMAKFSGPRESRLLLTGVAVAVLAHAAYDAVLFTGSALGLAVIPIVIFLWRHAVLHSRRALALDDERAAKPTAPR